MEREKKDSQHCCIDTYHAINHPEIETSDKDSVLHLPTHRKMAIDSSAEEPLLAANAHDQPFDDDDDAHSSRSKINNKVVAFMFIFVLVSDIGYFISIAPLTRIYEDITCRRYFQESRQTLFLNGTSGRPDEAQCKIPQVQGPVAELFGYQTFLDSLVGIFLGLYFGALADRVGRRPIFTIGTVGAFLSSCWTLYVCRYLLSI